MKKSLVLAMAMALGVTASAYAANPFSDVPAGHWAYDAVNKLAAEGVVDGYADSTFGGDKLMTRYEMAQIVAKAMAKGCNVDKLAAEFADELDSLGVRVANLEKKADNVKVTGQIRYAYADYDGNGEYYSRLRSRLWVKGQVNEDWSYTGMFQNQQDFTDTDNEEDDVDFQRAYVEGRLGGLDVTAGRYNMTLVNGNLYDHRLDGVEASYGKDVKFTAFAAKPTEMDSKINFDHSSDGVHDNLTVNYGKLYGAKVDAKIGAVNVTAGYTEFKDAEATYANGWSKANEKFMGPKNGPDTVELDDNKVWNVGVAFDLAKELTLTADYLKSDFDNVPSYYSQLGTYDLDDEGYVVGLTYKGAKAAEAGTWGLYANYYDQGRGTVMAHTMNGAYGDTGFEGYMVGVNYTLAKNIVAAVEYYDLESKGMGNEFGTASSEKDMETLWTQVVFTF